MSQPGLEERAAILARLREAERQVAQLVTLRREINEAIVDVRGAISGSMSGDDQRILAALQLSLEEIDRIVTRLRVAITEGRRYAESL